MLTNQLRYSGDSADCLCENRRPTWPGGLLIESVLERLEPYRDKVIRARLFGDRVEELDGWPAEYFPDRRSATSRNTVLQKPDSRGEWHNLPIGVDN
jgi:hypothetical protein